MLRCAVLSFLAGFGFVVAQQPTNVAWAAVDTIPAHVTGRVIVSWTPPSRALFANASGGATVTGFVVSASPLDFADPLDDPANSNFLLLDGDSAGGERVLSGAAAFAQAPLLAPSFSGGLVFKTHARRSSALPGRGAPPCPIALRKVPLAVDLVEATVACDGLRALPAWQCGITLFNGATNSSLFSFGLFSHLGEGGATMPAQLEASMPGAPAPLAATALQANGTPWDLAASTTGRFGAIVLRMMRGGVVGGPRNYSLSARLNVSDPADVRAWANLSVSSSQLPPFLDADVWVGMIACGFDSNATLSPVNSTTNSSAPMVPSSNSSALVFAGAAFSSFRIAAAVPSAPPPDLYGRADTCADLSLWNASAPITVEVPSNATNVTLRGLSGFFPYTLSVTAVSRSAAVGYVGFVSAPIPGVFFFARSMPPRSHMLSTWLDSKYLAGGPLARWPDSSFFGHDVSQSVLAQQPSTAAGTPYSPSTVTFSRARATVLRGGSDVFDLGIAGNLTIYVSAMGTTSAPQVILGRGPPATTVTSPPTSVGWSLSVWNTLFNPSPGTLGLKVADGVSPWSAGVTQAWWIPSMSTYTWSAAPQAWAFTSAKGPGTGPQVYSALLNGAASPVQGTGFADAVATNTSAAAAHSWLYSNTTASASVTELPPAVPDNALRVGGPLVANPQYSFDGQLFYVLMYRETHSAAQQLAVQQWAVT